MRTRSELIASLTEARDRVEEWRAKGERIRQLANEALDTREAREDRLHEVEETAGEIYQAIAEFKKLVAEVADQSPVAAGELAAFDDALHLVLLGITELGTLMYSVRSRIAQTDATKDTSP